MKKIILLSFCLLTTAWIYAQDDVVPETGTAVEEQLRAPNTEDATGTMEEAPQNMGQQPAPITRNIQINADPRIDRLVQAHIRSAKKNKVEGFRIQIIQDTDRKDMEEAKHRFRGAFPQLKLYETYDPPFYKLRAGNFTDRFEAYHYYQRIKPNFTRAFIVRDTVRK